MSLISNIPTSSFTYQQTGKSAKIDEMGMRPMQSAAYLKRGEPYLLIKSPPASGKSRALMFIALDKLHNQGCRQALIVVPERSIGGSFHSTPLSQYGFWADWQVAPQWNLCDAPGTDGRKVEAVQRFLASDDRILICTHATFRFALERFGAEAFDDRLIAIDEFHHVSAHPDNKLGEQVSLLIGRGKTHLIAMTGSYFRGDAVAVLHPDDEARFTAVTYTYYEQLNGYDYLKYLDIGYYFYSGHYTDAIMQVLDPDQKTILHIPNVNSRESSKDKLREVEHILELLGQWQGSDPQTGFQLIRMADGRVLKVADLVDDDPSKRDKVIAALKDPAHKENRDHVDIIIALGMAKEGFDWIWCEHALTVGYRTSLTEVVQIIGRATRDAPGKLRARFTNLIAEPDASEELVTEAVNDTLKAIAVSLLMEQVLAPRFEFRPKTAESGPTEGYDYGPQGYQPELPNVGYNEETGRIQVEIKGLQMPKSKEAQRVCREDMNELVAAFVQDKTVLERGLFDEETPPEELTQMRMGKIIKERYPHLDEEDQEAIRQQAVATIALLQDSKGQPTAVGHLDEAAPARSIVDDVRNKYALTVTDLDVDLIDRINPFGSAYAILAKSLGEERLRTLANLIQARRSTLTLEEARELAISASRFMKERGRPPSLTAVDPWERTVAEGAAVFVRYKDEGRYG